jgi:hypothetical protein
MRARKIWWVLERISALGCVIVGVLILRFVVWQDAGPLALAWAGLWLIGIPPLIVAERRLKRSAERPDAP